jgi:hypothetical protein
MLWFARSTAARRLLAATVVVSFSGCSFATVQRARPPAEIEDPRVADDCTTSNLAPGADTALAVAGVIAGNVILADATKPDPNCDSRRTTCGPSGNVGAGLAVAIAGAVFTGSAVYGYLTTAKCRNRVAAANQCAAGDGYACNKLRPTWSPRAGWRPPGALLEPAPAAAPASSAAAPQPVGTGMP